LLVLVYHALAGGDEGRQMSELKTVKCDICERLKLETNHWVVAILRPHLEGILFLPADAAEEPRREAYVYEDLCSQACANARFSRWLGDLRNIDFEKKDDTQ
jgi:endogenous inhibitor of DNA gyrase (YacG/DUF329 family)